MSDDNQGAELPADPPAPDLAPIDLAFTVDSLSAWHSPSRTLCTLYPPAGTSTLLNGSWRWVVVSVAGGGPVEGKAESREEAEAAIQRVLAGAHGRIGASCSPEGS